MKSPTMNFKKYYESLEGFSGPVLLKDVPKERYDVRGMIAYAKARGITTMDMTKDERARFLVAEGARQ